jgi:uncharacterized protein
MPYGMLRNQQTLPVISLACFTALFLLACDPTHPTRAVSSNPPPQKTLDTPRPPTVKRSPVPSQVLPVTAMVKLGNQVFELEVAKTHSQQALGLMYRTFLPSNRGMLFSFAPPQSVQFWMKHCRLSLDMIFLRQGKVIAIAANSPPCTTDPCPIYGPNELTDQVIEIRGNQAASIGLKVGDQVEISMLKIPR